MDVETKASPGTEPDSDESVVNDTELETAGTETEDDIENVDKIDFQDVVLGPSDWTVQTILSQLSSGSFELNPDFQRRNAWTDVRRSKFIESLFLGLPIPQIVLAEKETPEGDDKYIVIDGKQRLLALESFHSIDNPLRLSQLTVLSELNGLTREDLLQDPSKRKLASRLDNRTIRTVVIRKWKNDSFLHLVFHRINHQTLSLSAQELRQALNPGPFTRFADNFAGRSMSLHRALGASQQPDFRMRDVELLVRHLAYRFEIENYQGNLKKFLDDASKSFNASWATKSEDYEKAAIDCDEAILATEFVFGSQAFRRYTNSGGWENRFNRAVFDIMVYFFTDAEVRERAKSKKSEVVAAFKRLTVDDELFANSLASTTKTILATSYRLTAWGNALERTLDMTLEIPTLNSEKKRIEILTNVSE